MCGIAGIASKNTGEVTLSALKTMTDAIAHRGPDSEGQWISDSGKVGLGFRRLAIIDISRHADQPMHYKGRYDIVYNGEIYNYIECKEALSKIGYHFSTTSDVEVLLALYDKYRENCLQYLDGMFAFTIYDRDRNLLFCALDRFGEKPFFYSHKAGSSFIFGSEMKALWAGGLKKKVNDKMMFNYLLNGSLANPEDAAGTFYEDCRKLTHGHYLLLSLQDFSIRIKKYYDIDFQKKNRSISLSQATEKLHDLFYTSLQRRLRSDVSIGSSLSGGLDSSLIVSSVHELTAGMEQETFSAVFPDGFKDERCFIDMIIGKTHAKSHLVTPNNKGFVENLEQLCYHQEEPFNGTSIYAQYCVMQRASEQKVKVLLDGQGADEIFAGYHAYYPHYFSQLFAADRGLYTSEMAAYKKIHATNEINGYKGGRLKRYLNHYAPNTFENIRSLYHYFRQGEIPFFNPDFYKDQCKNRFLKPAANITGLNHALYNSTFGGGLQLLLRFADRNSMAHGCEIRLPFLYHELVEFLFSLPSGFKIKEGWTKWIMRKTFSRELPEAICWRKDKISYEPPHEQWMATTEIKEKIQMARAMLVEKGYLNKKLLLRKSAEPENKYTLKNNWTQLLAAEMLK